MRPCFHLIKSKPPNAEKLNGAQLSESRRRVNQIFFVSASFSPHFSPQTAKAKKTFSHAKIEKSEPDESRAEHFVCFFLYPRL